MMVETSRFGSGWPVEFGGIRPVETSRAGEGWLPPPLMSPGVLRTPPPNTSLRGQPAFPGLQIPRRAERPLRAAPPASNAVCIFVRSDDGKPVAVGSPCSEVFGGGLGAAQAGGHERKGLPAAIGPRHLKARGQTGSNPEKRTEENAA